MRTALSIAVGMALALAAPAAFAQDTTTGTAGAGGTAGASGTAEGTLPPPKVVTKTVETTTVAPAKKVEVEDEVSDHEKVVGHIGVGYLGLTNVPLAGGNGIPGSVNAPVIGVRYWLGEKLGLDLGLGLGVTSGSSESITPGRPTATTDSPTVLGAVLHGGVPLVFAHQKHYKFLLVPELNIGFAHATFSPQANGGAAPPDETHTGLLFDIGARIGAEVHFGFIGIPSLALQASVGAFFRHEGTKVSSEPNGGTVSVSTSKNTFGTSVQSDPWAIFANNISAIYYLP